MFNKRVCFILFALILLMGVASSVSANDLNMTDDLMYDDVNEAISQSSDSEMLNTTQKTFTDLNNQINGNDDGEIFLDSNYKFDPELDTNFKEGVNITRAVTVWGNGHTLDGNNAARIFTASSKNIVFRDIIFVNGLTLNDGGAVNGGNAVNCTFINNSAYNYGGAIAKGSCVNCSFIGNSASYGGATSSSSCVNCNFTENTANYCGGAMLAGSSSNCIFTRNSAYFDGGAIYYGSNTGYINIVNCSFVENSANVGGAINIMFSEYASIVNCSFARNSAKWEAGAIYNGRFTNCIFTENSAEYGGVMKYGNAYNCIFINNSAVFGGVNYQGSCIDCSLIENFADYGGAIFEGWRIINCTFTGNSANLGGAIYDGYSSVVNCTFTNNVARNGGAMYGMIAKNCNFTGNVADECGGAMYGESAVNCTFKNNTAYVCGNDTYNTQFSDINSSSISNSSNDENIIYFDASAAQDGDGSEDRPYKFLSADRIRSGVTAYFEDGTYDLNSTCIITGAKLMGKGPDVVINSKVFNQYDFIIMEDSYLELYRLHFNNINILNHAALMAENVYFEGTDVFDSHNLPEIESGSGLFDSSFGGVIVCDTPSNVKSALYLKGCNFEKVYGAYNGGAIAAINSNIAIVNTMFTHYSSTYKGGAIYCVNSDINIYNAKFTPSTSGANDDSITDKNGVYTAYYGGSIYCENSNIFIDRSNFVDSISFSFGGCIAAFNSQISAKECYFNDSVSLTDGGGAIYSSHGECYVFNSKLYNNSAEFGGAICNLNSIFDSYRSWYVYHSANQYGGVIYDIFGSLNLKLNLFGDSRALVGGTIYTRIPNVFNLYSNSIATSFAEIGSTIFIDGKREDTNSDFFSSKFTLDYDDLMIPSTGLENFNTFRHEYCIFAEFSATLNGEDYYIISNPIFYEISNKDIDFFYNPAPTYEVSDGLVSMMIHDVAEEGICEIECGGEIRNISASINLSTEFTNPVLKFYLIKGLNFGLYNYYGPSSDNLYRGSRDDLFKGFDYELAGTYTIDLSDDIMDSNHNLNGSCSIDFSNPFLNINYGNLYDAGSFYPVSLVNSSVNDLSSISPDLGPLSSYYNSNDWGFVSSVKDQKNGGNCWAFAGLATLETCLKKATGVDYDFSEENAKNLMAAYSVFGLKIETNYGGYDSMIMSYLTSWLGPIDESVEDYDDYSSISVQDNPMFHIQNIKFLPARLNSDDNDLYKLAIWDNGAIAVIFKWGKDYHAVSLVGWDDNYEGYDSIGNYANGAWIFKNSFGEDWGNNGFGYLSYEQKLSEELYSDMHAYTFIFNDINPYTKVYQYDFSGVSEFYHYTDSIYFKNTFEAEEDSLLSAVSTYFDRQTNYTLMVYVNNDLVLSQNGTSPAGYYTMPLNNFIQLNKGDKFSIAVNNHNLGYNCIPVSAAYEITQKTYSANVSFISLDGEEWFDLYDYADSCHVACIKAFTQNINLTSIKMNIGEFRTVNTKNINIKVNFDDFIGLDSINYCLVKFIVDGNIYYAQIRNGSATLNLNLEEGVHTLFAQYKDNVFESNIIQFNFTVNIKEDNSSFNALQDIINDAPNKSSVILNKDYSYDSNFDDVEYGVHINKPIVINGNGHVIDGLSEATGFYISANNVVLNNIVFKDTFSINGGAIYIAARNVTLNNCSFINSKATECGGAIYSLFDVNLNNCKFINNTANIGGGLYLISNDISYIKDSCFDDNYAYLQGSAVYITGGGYSLVSSTDFTNNVADYNGGAVHSSVYYNEFSGCIFSNNSAKSGGAIFSSANLNNITGCYFSNNFAKKVGGAINVHNLINVYDSEFFNNSVNNSEDNLLPLTLVGGYGGGAIYSFDDLNVYDSRFIENHVKYAGGAIYTSKYLNVYRSNFTNNFAYQGGGAIYNNEWQLLESNMGVLKFSESYYYDSNFINNSASKGGGGAIYDADLVKNCTFINNHVSNTGGAIYDVGEVIESRFINNSASFAGAIYYDGIAAFHVYNSVFADNHAEKSGGAIYSNKYDYYYDRFISSTNVHNSSFINNSANYGGVIYSEGDVNSHDSNFISNYANYSGGAIKSSGNLSCNSSSFINNSAKYGGAIDSNGTKVSYCNFTDNLANVSGGAIYSEGNGYITDSGFVNSSAVYGGAIYSRGNLSYYSSSFINNSAEYGGAILSFECVNVSSCIFTNDYANLSGGAIYAIEYGFISDSTFADNLATYGGAIYLEENGTYSIAGSNFCNNSAEFGGAIHSSSPDEENMSFVNVTSCNFTDNHVNKSGGAVYSDGNTSVAHSSFVNNTANWGSAIYSLAYLNVTNSSIKSSQNSTAIYFTYHHSDDNETVYGDLYLKGNKIDTKDAAVFFNDNETQYKLPLYLVFNEIVAGKGQYVSVCRIEDEDGTSFLAFEMADLNLTVTNENRTVNVNLKYNGDLGGYYFDTSSLDYGTYVLDGKLAKNHPGNYTVKQGSLNIVNESDLHSTVLNASDLTKTYGENDTLTINLKDSFGNAIVNASLNVHLNGNTTILITNDEGQADLTVNLTPGEYTAYIVFDGNGLHDSSVIAVKVVVEKITPVIVASKKTFKLKAKTKKFTVRLMDSSGKAMINEKVTVKVNGKKYKAKTNSKGKVKFKLKLNKKGKYKAKIKFKGNEYYGAVSKKVKITVKK